MKRQEMKYEDFEQVGRNLYIVDGKYFRLFSDGPTPNGCWLVNPAMWELVDISVGSGLDVYGDLKFFFDVCGTVPAIKESIVVPHV